MNNEDVTLEIITDDIKTYQTIARVVDQNSFRVDIFRLRGKWRKLRKDLLSLIQSPLFFKDVESLLKKYKLHYLFQEVIIDAVHGDRIRFLGNLSCYPIITPEGQLAIVVGNDTTQQELLNVFKELKSGKSNRGKDFALFALIKKGMIPLKGKDVYSNIKRDREWYWQKKAEMSYQKILDETEKKGISITREGIIKAVKQYEQFLDMET